MKQNMKKSIGDGISSLCTICSSICVLHQQTIIPNLSIRPIFLYHFSLHKILDIFFNNFVLLWNFFDLQTLNFVHHTLSHFTSCDKEGKIQLLTIQRLPIFCTCVISFTCLQVKEIQLPHDEDSRDNMEAGNDEAFPPPPSSSPSVYLSSLKPTPQAVSFLITTIIFRSVLLQQGQ